MIVVNPFSAALAVEIEEHIEIALVSSPTADSFGASGLPAGLAVEGRSIRGAPTVAGRFVVSITATLGAETSDPVDLILIVETASERKLRRKRRDDVVTFTLPGGAALKGRGLDKAARAEEDRLAEAEKESHEDEKRLTPPFPFVAIPFDPRWFG